MNHRNFKPAALDYRDIGMVSDRYPTRIPDDRLPLLVTGISGVAGLNAFAFLRRRYGEQIFGQRPSKTFRLVGPGIHGFDLDRTGSLRRFVREKGIRSILSCGGSCNLKGCEIDTAMARRVNVESIESQLTVADDLTRIVHLSIDLVFGGTRGGGHVETDATDPVTYYGKTMVDAEELLLSKLPGVCIGRISLPMGISFNSHAGAVDWIQSRFAAGKPATLYFDEIRTPTYVECLAEVCEDLVAGTMTGLWHLGGPRRLTLNEIAQVVNLVGGYDPALCRGCFRIEAGPMPPRAGDVSMDSSRIAAELGRAPFAPWPFWERLVPDSRDWHFERSDFVGSPKLIGELLYRRPREMTGRASDF